MLLFQLSVRISTQKNNADMACRTFEQPRAGGVMQNRPDSAVSAVRLSHDASRVAVLSRSPAFVHAFDAFLQGNFG
jgi:hypothetical protein